MERSPAQRKVLLEQLDYRQRRRHPSRSDSETMVHVFFFLFFVFFLFESFPVSLYNVSLQCCSLQCCPLLKYRSLSFPDLSFEDSKILFYKSFNLVLSLIRLHFPLSCRECSGATPKLLRVIHECALRGYSRAATGAFHLR